MSSKTSRVTNLLTYRGLWIITSTLDVGDRDLVARCIRSIFLQVSSEVSAVKVLFDVSHATSGLLSASYINVSDTSRKHPHAEASSSGRSGGFVGVKSIESANASRSHLRGVAPIWRSTRVEDSTFFAIVATVLNDPSEGSERRDVGYVCLDRLRDSILKGLVE